jgi:hypothetical protein
LGVDFVRYESLAPVLKLASRPVVAKVALSVTWAVHTIWTSGLLNGKGFSHRDLDVGQVATFK